MVKRNRATAKPPASAPPSSLCGVSLSTPTATSSLKDRRALNAHAHQFARVPTTASFVGEHPPRRRLAPTLPITLLAGGVLSIVNVGGMLKGTTKSTAQLM